ncbi:MAG: hypothetical protein ACQESR_24830, partial [Planctomycetota bacterium]
MPQSGKQLMVFRTVFFFTIAAAIVPMAAAEKPLEPVHFQKIRINDFWNVQVKRLTEQWIPHCIKQMEQGGEGEELLNLVHAAKALQGEEHG